jgi:hypothetical protein
LLYDPPDGQLGDFAEFVTSKFFSALEFGGELTAVDIPRIMTITDPEGEIRWFVEADEHTTDEEWRRALRMVRSLKGAPDQKEGRPRRDPLLCINLALRYGQRNRKPEDPRRWTVTYETLGEEFDMSAGAVKEHVEEGKKLLRENP